MKLLLLRLCCLFCALSVWLAPAVHPALAKGPFAKIVISGPGLAEVATITDDRFMQALSLGMFEDFHTSLQAPARGEGYELARYYQSDNGTFEVFDRLTYYPNPSGGRAYIFYNGLEGNGWSEYDGHWFYAKPNGEVAMQDLLNQLGVKLTLAQEVHRISKNIITIIIPPATPEAYHPPFRNPWRYTPCSAVHCWRVK